MKIEDIKDECSKCKDFLSCVLCRQGHGVGMRGRENIAKMFECQLNHRKAMERRENVGER